MPTPTLGATVLLEDESLTVSTYRPAFRRTEDPVSCVEVLSTAWSRPSLYVTPAQARALAAALVAAAEVSEAAQAAHDAEQVSP